MACSRAIERMYMRQLLSDHAITVSYGERAGLKMVSRSMAKAMRFPYAEYTNGGCVFPYLHPLTREPHSTLMRIRYYDVCPWVDANGRATRRRGEAAKDIRYIQPKGSDVEAFFDSNIDWKVVFANPKIDIRFVEGEFKALYMNQHWREFESVTVALGGVWNFREKGGKDLTPWLRMVRAASQNGRKLIVTFDSDAEVNVDVARAETEFMKLLAVRA